MLDNGTNFVSDEFEKFLHGNFIKHMHMPHGHHQSNGLAERKILELKFWPNKQHCANNIDYQPTAFCLHTNNGSSSQWIHSADIVFVKSIRTRLSALHLQSETCQQLLNMHTLPIKRLSLLLNMVITRLWIIEKDLSMRLTSRLNLYVCLLQLRISRRKPQQFL